MDITAIERNFRLYGRPGFLIIFGLVGLILIDPSAPAVNQIDQILAPFRRALFLGAAGVMAIGFLWMGWRVWLEYRWMRGDLVGGCDHCAGPMRNLTGRWGNYSKCLMCGSTKKGCW